MIHRAEDKQTSEIRSEIRSEADPKADPEAEPESGRKSKYTGPGREKVPISA